MLDDVLITELKQIEFESTVDLEIHWGSRM